jgi:hypothetical protein
MLDTSAISCILSTADQLNIYAVQLWLICYRGRRILLKYLVRIIQSPFKLFQITEYGNEHLSPLNKPVCTPNAFGMQEGFSLCWMILYSVIC